MAHLVISEPNLLSIKNRMTITQHNPLAESKYPNWSHLIVSQHWRILDTQFCNQTGMISSGGARDGPLLDTSK